MGGNKEMFAGSVISSYILGDETGSLGAAFTVVAAICLLASVIGFYVLINRLIPGKKNG
jgi:ABC-type spermidine/putrescine transport system permease subunit I